MRVSYTSEVRRRSGASRRSFSAELPYVLFTVLLGLQFGLCRPDDAGNARESPYEYASSPPQPGLPGISGEGQQIIVCSPYLQSRESSRESVGVDTAVSVDGATVSSTTQVTACASTVKVPAEFVGASRCVSEALLEHEQRMVACGLDGYGKRKPGLVLAGRGSR